MNFPVDIHGAVPITDFTGRALVEKSYTQSLKIKGTPTLLFYDLDGKEVARILGTVREPGEFLLLGEFIASGAYRTRQFAEFKQARNRKKGG